MELLRQRQEELQKLLSPFNELQNSPLIKQLRSLQNSPLAKQLSELQNSPLAKQFVSLQNALNSFNFGTIKIPKTTFTVDEILPKVSDHKGISADVIITDVAEKKPELKEALESKQQIKNYSEQLDGIESQLNELTKNSKDDKENIHNRLTDITKQLENTTDIINKKLSPSQTLGIAFLIGTFSSFIGSALFSIWTQTEEIIATAPTIINSTIP